MAFLRTMALGAIISVNLSSTAMSNLAVLSGRLNGVQSQFSLAASGSRFLAAGLGQIAIASGAAAAGLALGATKAAEFEHAMQGVMSVGPVGAEDRKQLEKKALTLGGGESKFNPMEIASGMEEMRRAGFDVQQTLEGIGVMADVAAADMIDMATATNIVGNVFRAFDNGMLSLTHTGDVLARASADTNTNIQELGLAMQYAGTVSRNLKIPLEDATAAIAEMSQVGLKGNKAGRGFASVLQSLAAPSKNAQAVMDQLHFAWARTADGGVDLFGTLEHLADEMSGVTDVTKRQGIATKIAGKDQAKVFLALIDQIDAAKKLRNSWIDLDGAAHKMAMIRLDSVIGQLTMLKNAAIAFGIELMSAFGPGMKTTIEQIKNVLMEVNKGLLGDGSSSTFAMIGVGMKAAIDDINAGIALFVTLGNRLNDEVLGRMGPLSIDAAYGIGYLSIAFVFLLAALFPIIGPLSLVMFVMSGMGEAGALLAVVISGVLLGALVALASGWTTANAMGMSFFGMLKTMLDQGNLLWVTFKLNFLAAFGPMEEKYLPLLTILKATWDNIAEGIRVAGGWMLKLFSPEVMAEFGRAAGFLARLGVLALDFGAALLWIGSFIFNWFVAPVASAIMAVVVGIAYMVAAIIDVIGTAVTELVNSPVIKFGLERFGLDGVVGFDEAGVKADIENIKKNVKKNVDDAMAGQAAGKGAATPGAQEPPKVEVVDKRCLHVKTDVNLDGRSISKSVKEREVEMTERAGFGLTPWQKRQILENGAAPIVR